MKCFNLFRKAACALLVASMLSFAGTAKAQTVPLEASGEGQVILQIDPTLDEPVGIQVYYFAGTSTLVGQFSGAGVTYFRADGTVLESFFHAVGADGSTISNTYTGSFAPIPGTTDFLFEVEQDWGNGTGRLAGVTGEGSVVAVLDGLTGAFTAEASGDWILP